MQGNVRILKDKDGNKFYPVTHQSAIFYDDGESLEVKEEERATAETNRATAETGRVNAESARAAAEATRVTEFAGIKDQVKLVDITPVTTVRAQIVASPTGTYSYAGGQTIDANKLVTIEQNPQVEINYGFDFQVVGTNVINKSTYANEMIKFINDNTNMGVLK